MNDDTPGKEILIRMLSALFPDAKIYLFGSRALKTHDFRSDIDIALDLGRKLTLSELAMAMNMVETLNVPRKIDIVDLNGIPNSMRESILKEGIVWKS